MHGYGGIAEHGFGARGRYGDGFASPGDRIADVPEVAFTGLMHGFEVGDGGLAARAPVDHVLAAIDQALFVEADEHFADGAGEAGIQGEALAATNRSSRRGDHLALDASAVFCFPLPDAGSNSSRPSCGGSIPLSASWRSTTIWVAMPAWSVPGSQRVISPRMRCQRTGDIDLGVFQHVTDVEGAGHVGRRNDQREDAAACGLRHSAR